MKIEHNKEACIGYEDCVNVCPENWEMKDGKAFPKKTRLSKLGNNKEAADICPVQCIKIKE